MRPHLATVPVAFLLAAGGCASTLDIGEVAVRETTQVANAAVDAAYRGAAVSVDAVREAARSTRQAAAPPQFAPISDPSGLTGGQQRSMPQPMSASASMGAANSLWQSGARAFFDDQRARRIGDILTVNIRIADRAEVSNSSNRTRSSSTDVGVDSFLGLEAVPGSVLPGGYDPGNLIDAQASSTAAGTGSINREEVVELTVAAVVVDTLPNGNLVISGRQEVRINGELRELTVAGVIRPEDVASDNTIRHDQMAEARISYGGRGQISAVQRPRIGQRVADAISPW
ncbi:MAG: flagellar basal body L-ring protein FlgH [Caulobacterales bacterium]